MHPHALSAATYLATWIVLAIVLLHAAINAAEAGEPGVSHSDYASQARQFELQFRAGNAEVVPDYVAAMDEATRVDPDNADNWYWLGRAYLALGARGIDQMNQAVQIAPDSTRVRLQRAFLGMNLPDELRNREYEAEDLDFLIENSDPGVAADYVRILRGDLDAENGNLQQAAAYYRSVEGSGTRASSEAAARLSEMKNRGVTSEDILRLRKAAGAECAMCHRQ